MVGMFAFRRVRRSRVVAAVVSVTTAVLLVALTGCGNSSSNPDGDKQVQTLPPATAPAAPPGSPERVAGITAPVPAGSSGVAVSGETVGVLGPGGTQILRFATATPTAPPATTETPRLVALHPVGDGSFLGAGPGVVVRVDPTGAVQRGRLSADDPLTIADAPGGRVLVGTAGGHVLVLDADLRQVRDIPGFVRVDDITVAPSTAGDVRGQVVVLDRAQSSVTPVDLDSGELGPALRAGNGATNATVDKFGRILVANTRDGEIVGFFGSPLVMRFRYPMAGGPYAVDYDDTRGLLWVSGTADNEVVAYDLASGEPSEKHRVASVAQPDTIAVDDRTGTLYVLSGRDGVLQIIGPPYPLSGVSPVRPG
ncbi:hypothetical protein GCM10009624_06880 [Gordonia sinesedis]